MARAKPRRCGTIQEQAVSGIRPILANGSMKAADSVATTMSHTSARLAPAPAAMPLTAAMVGTRRLASCITSGL